MKIGDLICWTDYTVGPNRKYVGLYIGDVDESIKCWEDIYLLVGSEKMKVCSWQCEVLNG